MEKCGENNLRFKPLDYSQHPNSWWGLKIFFQFKKYFNSERFNYNIQKLKKFSLLNRRYLPYAHFYAHYWRIYKPFIIKFDKYFVDSTKELSKTIPYSNKKAISTFKEIKEYIKKKLMYSSLPWVIISDDHRISHITISTLTSLIKKKAAIIVIDNHADIYGRRPAGKIPLKFNPFLNLLEQKVIQHVIFLCPQFTEILQSQDNWFDLRSSISLIPFQRKPEGNLDFNFKLFEGVFLKIVKEKRIETIYFSIDIDALSDYKEKYYILPLNIQFSIVSFIYRSFQNQR